MSDINKPAGENKGVDQSKENEKNEPLPVHNPLKPGDHTPITQEDIENEQKYKEALSERD